MCLNDICHRVYVCNVLNVVKEFIFCIFLYILSITYNNSLIHLKH